MPREMGNVGPHQGQMGSANQRAKLTLPGPWPNPTYLHGCALCRKRREAHDVAEVDGDAVKGLCLDCLASLQLLSHRAEG